MMKTTSAVIFLTAFSLLGCSKPQKADAYHVVAYRHGAFIIEHKGQRLTVKCEQAWTWLDGLDKDPRPLTDPGQCMYMGSLVGDYIGEDLMLESGLKLQYCPWRGVNTVQTSDNMTITDIEEIR
jgi:hypothetical protein